MLTEGLDSSYKDPNSPAPNRCICLYFYPAYNVAELEQSHARLAASGQAVEELYSTDYDHREFMLRDPDGNILTFGVLISPDLWPGNTG